MAIAMSSSQRATITLGSIGAIIAVLSVAVWSRLPVGDDPAYFNFADTRFYFGLPNFYDVFSNVFFIHISLFTLFFAIRRRHQIEKRIWDCFILFNLAVFFTGLGSSYFHLSAHPHDLIWDRMPMAVAFASLLTLILVERVVMYYHRLILLALNVLGVWSVWTIDHAGHDMRTYILVQFGSLLAIVLILLFFPKGHIHRGYLWFGLLCYGVGKVCEINDHPLFELTAGGLSGHTIKHLISAVGVLSLNLGVLTSQRQKILK